MPNFKIAEDEVEVLKITVLEGHGVTVGWSDIVDTPDPYVKLMVTNSPNGKQRTQTIPDETNPTWNKDFSFFLDPEKDRVLEIVIMDEDFGFDDTVGRQSYDLRQLKTEEPVYHTFQFGEKTFVDVKMVIEINSTKQLRYGHGICDDEINFIEKRKRQIFDSLKKLLPDEQAPKDLNEVPVVAVMGSGGGFRAMCGLAGVFTALEETGILDCSMFVSGLSGSSWYISTLYSHSIWPNRCCEKVASDIADRIDESFTRLLTPSHLVKYFKYMNERRCLGYPVSFTDFFGCLVGDTLLEDTKFKLTYTRAKVRDGNAPLPLCTALHVEKDVSAQLFSEWLEFTPFEVGVWRYGVFLRTEHFGGKFYKGRLIRDNHEPYLHYLQGVWGSAFTILFQRLLDDDGTTHSDDGKKELADFCSSDALTHTHEDDESDDEVETPIHHRDEQSTADETDGNAGILSRIGYVLAFPFVWVYRAVAGGPPAKKAKKEHITKAKDEPFWMDWLDSIVHSSSTLSSRQGRAAQIHNIFRGLNISPVDPNDKERTISSKVKEMFVVDGGLNFNSPYPCLLRPQRAVQLIISFDFSQRDSDNAPPFAELLLAEEWARENNRPFPPVKDNPIIKDPNVKELYIFEDVNDSNCPIVLHFVLINKTFKDYKEPGVPRETEEEKSFGDFSVFDDPEVPYSSFKFDLTHRQFERLYGLMKFNTLLNIDTIKEKIAGLVKSRRNNKPT